MIAAFLAAALLGGCGGISDPGPPGNGGTDDPTIAEAELRLLWIGNSLTQANDLPALFAQVAEAGGHEVAWATHTAPNTSLEDHWIRGEAERTIRRERPDVVILQQGPSSLPESREHLRTWSARFAEVARASAGRPALFMVWPPAERDFAFDDVSTSYREAAEAVDAFLIPGGEAMREAWRSDAGLALRSSDGFHPTRLGSLLVALVAYRVLFGEPVTGLPPAALGLDADMAETLFGAAEAAAIAHGRR